MASTDLETQSGSNITAMNRFGSLTPLDNALTTLHGFHSEYCNGLSDHGPMVIEALDRIGRQDAITPWLERYLGRLDPLEPNEDAGPLASLDPLDPWSTIRSETEWIAYFVQAVEELGWQETIAAWVPRLTPALPTAAAHGVLRASHAVRGLGRGDSPARRHELARGCAYWAWRREELPALECGGGLTTLQALAGIRVPPADSPDALTGMISDRLRGVATSEFLTSVQAVSLPRNPAEALTEVVTTAGVALYSAPPSGRFAILHGLTSAIAVRDLLPFLSDTEATRLVEYSWATVAALWASYSVGADLKTEPSSEVPTTDALLERAVNNGDEHAIKVATAVWSEELASATERPDLRAAADSGLQLFGA